MSRKFLAAWFLALAGATGSSCATTAQQKSTGTNWLDCQVNEDCRRVPGAHCGDGRVCVDSSGKPIDRSTLSGAPDAMVDGGNGGAAATGSGGSGGSPNQNRDASTVGDTTPPVFAGAMTATPAGPGTVRLTWNAATDDVTESSGIVYDVYAAMGSRTEHFSQPPMVTTDPGKTEVEVSGFATRTGYYFVVRARDRAGNEDKNLVELTVVLPLSFALDVQPIFTAKCTVIGCHTAADPSTPPKQGLNLDAGAAYSQLVNVPVVEGQSLGEPNLVRVSTDGVLANSYMWRKITRTPPFIGSIEPPSISPNGPVDPDQRQIITDWISAGAPNN